VPTIGALDDPATRTPANASDEGRFSAPTNVRLDASSANRGFAILVVVSFVETKVARTARPSRRSNGNRIERLAHHPLVVDVGAGQRDANRDATAVGQHMTFGAQLAAIGGIGAREVPPFGAFTEALSSEDQFQSMPRSSS